MLAGTLIALFLKPSPGVRKAGRFAPWLYVMVLLCFAPAHAQETSQSAPAESSRGTASDESIQAAMPRGKKLMLTDGSFQIVREYEQKGDRVRYYSVERSSWEELPADMVDWAATKKAASESEAADKETLNRIRATTASEIATTIDTGSSLQVGSGEFLPDSPGVYVLDGQTVRGLLQVESTVRLDKGRAVLKGISGIPFISSKQFIEVPGKRAKLRIQTVEPEFYLRTTDGRTPNIMLMRAEIMGERRRVTTAVTDVVGNTKYVGKEISVLTSQAAVGVQRMVMNQKLEPGEYALLETTPEGLSSYVWEFGVDVPPKANGTGR